MIPRRVQHFGDMLWVLVSRDMKLRYKRSVLGLLWTIVNPLSQLLVFHFVFAQLFKVSIPHFTVYLFVGIVVWTWFSSSLVQVTTVFIDNQSLLGQPGFPISVLPIATVSSHLLHFLLTIPVILVLMWINDVPLGVGGLVALPLLIVCQFLMVLGLAYVVASLQVGFHDTQYLLTVGLMLWFYLTPIFYSIDMVPERLLPIFELNPMTRLISAYRSVFVDGEVPPSTTLLLLAAFGLVFLTVGHFVHRRFRGDFLREM